MGDCALHRSEAGGSLGAWLREDDHAALGGRIERCTRKLHPIGAHDWDLIVTRWCVLGRGGALGTPCSD